MGKYVKKPIVIEAFQWWKHGDHPEVRTVPPRGIMVEHEQVSWIKTLEGGHVVSPGDWIIKGIQGEHYPCKPDIFEATYEKFSDYPTKDYKIELDLEK